MSVVETLACDVAIVGSGPAGLGAAIALRRRHAGRVVVLERAAAIGGVPRHCAHPPYGLREFGRVMTGPAYARRLHALAADHGVEFFTQCSVVALEPQGQMRVANPGGMLNVSARRVLLATGAREATRAARLVSGDRPLGVINTGALQESLYLAHLPPAFTSPVVVGTELVGLSALWTCLRHGMRPAAVIEAGDRPTARWPLGLFPGMLGVPIHFRSRIARIHGGPRVTEVDILAGSGETRTIACDGVIFTGGFLPEASLMQARGLQLDRGSRGPAIDQYGRCSDPAYFAAGNVLHPIETAGWCFREGGRIGDAIAEDLRGALPSPASRTALSCGPGIAYAAPQALCVGGPPTGLANIQLRVSAPVSGTLTLRQGKKPLFRQRVSTRPERRIVIPLAGLRLQQSEGNFSIAIERSGG